MWLAIALGLVALVVLLAEVAVRTLGRARLEALLATSLGPDVSVELADRPVLLGLARRRLSQVELRAHRVPLQTGDELAAIERLDVDLRGVRLVRGSATVPIAVSAEAGRFEAHLTEEQVGALADLPDYVRDLTFEDGHLWVTAVGFRVATTVSARDGRVVVAPAGRTLAALPFGELVFDLPELPAGAVVEELEVRDGYVVARGPVDGDRLLPDR